MLDADRTELTVVFNIYDEKFESKWKHINV